MVRIGNKVKEAVSGAADAAREELTDLYEKKKTLEEQIAHLEAIVRADESFKGVKKVKDSDETTELQADGRKRARRGQVAKHIDAVLSDGAEMDEPAIRNKIDEVFSIRYGRATVYTALRRGHKEHKYLKDGSNWKLSGLVTLKSA